MFRIACFAIAVVMAGPVLAQKGSKPTADAAAADPNKKICKRYTVTGSLAQTQKVCKTRAEWNRHHAQTRTDAQNMMGLNCGAKTCVDR